MKTHFNDWSVAQEEDPHGDRYTKSDELIMVLLPDRVVAHAMRSKHLMAELTSIQYLMAAKDRLRWLSRKLQNTLAEQGVGEASFCEARFKMALGNLTDDALANQFFLDEEYESLSAGADRIEWLSKELSAITDYRGYIKTLQNQNLIT